MRNLCCLILVVSLSSCFLFKDYRKKEFSYTNNGRTQSLPILVPKGFVKEEMSDTAGIKLYTYQYPGGAVLYAAHLTDTTYELQAFNKDVHRPLSLAQGGRVYKGQTANGLFYREIRQGTWRFGYKDVPRVNESYFDSATNYASWQKR